MYVEDSAELTGRYSGTYIGLREGNIISPIYVNNFSGSGKTLRSVEGALYRNVELNIRSELVVRKVQDTEIMWDAPLLGFVNTLDKKAKFIARIPEEHGHGKQRGLIPHYTRYWYTDGFGFIESALSDLMMNPNVADICSVYNPKYVSLEEAWLRIREGEHQGAAISRNIALFKTKLTKTPLVFYKNLIAGIYNKKTNTVQLRRNAHLLYEEVSMYAKCEKTDAPVKNKE